MENEKVQISKIIDLTKQFRDYLVNFDLDAEYPEKCDIKNDRLNKKSIVFKGAKIFDILENLKPENFDGIIKDFRKLDVTSEIKLSEWLETLCKINRLR